MTSKYARCGALMLAVVLSSAVPAQAMSGGGTASSAMGQSGAASGKTSDAPRNQIKSGRAAVERPKKGVRGTNANDGSDANASGAAPGGPSK
jgi:hypothetical protein